MAHDKLRELAEFANLQLFANALVANDPLCESSKASLMQTALSEAALGTYTTSPNPAVGCVIVRQDSVLGMGHHKKAGEPHAEVMALKDANYQVEDATCFVTLEPCSHYGRTPPCAKALCEAKVKKVVIANADPNPLVAGRGIKMLRDVGIEVEVGLGQELAFDLNRAFFKSITTHMPFVLLKYGMSLDAKIALSNGESKWITNAACRSDVQQLRAWADAMITSMATVRADDPKLNVRYSELPKEIKEDLPEDKLRQPVKVVLDSKNSLTSAELESYAIFKSGKTYVIHGDHSLLAPDSVSPELASESENTAAQPVRFKLEKELAPDVWSVAVPFDEQHVDLKAVLEFLDSLQIRVAMVEAGAILGAAFIEQDLVDELCCYVSPKLLGEQAQFAFKLPEPTLLRDAKEFECVETKLLEGNVKMRMQHPRITELKKRMFAKNQELNSQV